MSLPQKELETALENHLSVLSMLRKSYFTQTMNLSDDEFAMFKKEWPAWDNFQTTYDIILITKEVCRVRFGEGT